MTNYGSNIKAPVTATLDAREIDENGLIITGMCLGAPPTTAGIFVHGATLVRTDSGTGVKAVYENVGSTAVPSWNLMGDVTASEISLVEGSMLVGNSSGVATALDGKTSGQILVGNGTTVVSVAVSGDAILASSGALTVVSANAAFNVGTNITWTKEVNHTMQVSTTTTAATAGGNLTISAGIGATSGTGGTISVSGGTGGTSGAGGAATLAGGAAGTGSANAVGGQANVTGGASQGTSAGGAVVLTSGASENGTAVSPGASGAISLVVGAAGTATTGTAGAGGAISLTGAAGGNSTGASSTAGAGSDASITAGAGGASSGGGDTGGRGGNVVLTSGAAGTGATAGLAGMIFARGPFSRKSISTTATDTTTLTMAQILSGTIRCTPTAAASYTMPTGAVIAAALPAAFTTGDCLDFVLCNVATNDTFDITLVTAASGTTLFGNLIVEANSAAAKWSSAIFRIECTGASTYNVIRVA